MKIFTPKVAFFGRRKIRGIMEVEITSHREPIHGTRCINVREAIEIRCAPGTQIADWTPIGQCSTLRIAFVERSNSGEEIAWSWVRYPRRGITEKPCLEFRLCKLNGEGFDILRFAFDFITKPTKGNP